MDASHDVLDHSLKLVWKYDPEALLRLAFGPNPPTAGEPIAVEIVETVRRAADGARWVHGPFGPHVVHAEFETHAESDVPHRLLFYNVCIGESLPGRPVVRSVLFLLKRPKRKPSGTLTVKLGGEVLVTFRYLVVEVYKMSAAELAADPLLAQFAPLGRGAGRAHGRDLAVAAELIHQTAGEQVAERLGILGMLARATGLPEAEVEAILQRSEVRMAYAMQEIWLEGKIEGKIEGAKAVVGALLRRRFPAHTAEVEALLTMCPLDDLDWLAGEIVTAKRFATLKRDLAERVAPAK